MNNGTPRGLCNEPYCKRLRRKDRFRCHMHDTRRKRSANPMRDAFRNLRHHARERGILFTLSFSTFRIFALQSNYLNRKGLNGHSLTVDRIDNLRGYVAGNIQPLTRARNAEKKAKQDAIRMHHGMEWKNNESHTQKRINCLAEPAEEKKKSYRFEKSQAYGFFSLT